jgi:hypothetical protein
MRPVFWQEHCGLNPEQHSAEWDTPFSPDPKRRRPRSRQITALFFPVGSGVKALVRTGNHVGPRTKAWLDSASLVLKAATVWRIFIEKRRKLRDIADYLEVAASGLKAATEFAKKNGLKDYGDIGNRLFPALPTPRELRKKGKSGLTFTNAISNCTNSWMRSMTRRLFLNGSTFAAWRPFTQSEVDRINGTLSGLCSFTV